MKIVIDADACPQNVLDICFRVAEEYSLKVWTVANFNHNINSKNHIVVGNAPEETDIRVANMTVRGDIVVTQDWGLAALVLGKGAAALTPKGKILDKGNIDFLLEVRNASARHRRGGGKSRGPRKREKRDDNVFEGRLRQIINSLLKPTGPNRV